MFHATRNIGLLLVLVLLPLEGLSWSDFDEWREGLAIQGRGLNYCRSQSGGSMVGVGSVDGSGNLPA
jgi:hypothetical protein